MQKVTTPHTLVTQGEPLNLGALLFIITIKADWTAAPINSPVEVEGLPSSSLLFRLHKLINSRSRSRSSRSSIRRSRLKIIRRASRK